MSLLIKALDKAESDKVEHAGAKQKQAEKSKTKTESAADLELSLSPADSILVEPVPAAKVNDTTTQSAIQTTNQTVSHVSKNTAAPLNTSTSSNSPKSAANVFSAKGVETKTDSARLALIAGAGLIALLGMGLYFYQFVDNTPPVMLPPRPLEPMAAQTTPVPETEMATEVLTELAPTEAVVPEMPSAFAQTEPMPPVSQRENSIKERTKVETMAEEDELIADETEATDIVAEDNSDALKASFSATKANKSTRKSKNNASIASNSASISVSKSTPQPSVNPALMAAYEAYNAGNDNDAIKLYKQVLQRDVRNVDALLGLGAIAARQGRTADANGWYAKVLDVDPRNSIAQAALLDNQSQGNEQANETSLKNMLSKQPDDANLHVALGNLYAEQNQWPAAQQAYFDAYSLNKSADNAYNLAVSLDQMGKPKLALPYYQRALEQASGNSNIDKAALEARIAAIQ